MLQETVTVQRISKQGELPQFFFSLSLFLARIKLPQRFIRSFPNELRSEEVVACLLFRCGGVGAFRVEKISVNVYSALQNAGARL